MNIDTLKRAALIKNSDGIGTVTRGMVRDRAVELAIINGHCSQDVSKAEWEQAKRELSGEPIPPPVLRSAKHLYGMKLGTDEGPIGHVEDFYFDDEHWAVRYIVADTGDWLAGRLVLLSPHAFGSFDQNDGSMIVNLKRQQIENSPAIETHKPVSRQFEEGYCGYYGFPPYWEAAGMWGMGVFPMAPPPHLVPIREEAQAAGPVTETEPHLRSTKAITGYHIQTHEGEIGHVIDFTIEDKSWAIRHLVVETGHWYSGKEIVISPRDVDRISYEESKVYVSVSRKDIQDAPDYHLPPVKTAYHDTRNFD